MTPDEYEATRRRLNTDIEDARQTLNRARAHYERLCGELVELNRQQSEDPEDQP